jgi:hypothetical protein
LAYDPPFFAWSPSTEEQVLRLLPNVSHYKLANSIVFKHVTYDGSKRNGWLWSMQYAQALVKRFANIKYVYHTNGDCLWEKPEGLPDLIRELGEADVMAGQQHNDTLHTADVIWKVDAFHRCFDYMGEILRVPVLGSHSPEKLLMEGVRLLKLKVKVAPEQPRDPVDGTVDMYARYDQDSTFKRLVGFRNLFAVYETAGNEGRDPNVSAYADLAFDGLYWGGEERETIVQFWKTGDRRYLYRWIAQWEDSDYNRLFYRLEDFGPEPILVPVEGEPWSCLGLGAQDLVST